MLKQRNPRIYLFYKIVQIFICLLLVTGFSYHGDFISSNTDHKLIICVLFLISHILWLPFYFVDNIKKYLEMTPIFNEIALHFSVNSLMYHVCFSQIFGIYFLAIYHNLYMMNIFTFMFGSVVLINLHNFLIFILISGVICFHYRYNDENKRAIYNEL